jgi:HTH-type transcriptional regulator, sugar sensing transcriptional regulator
MDSAVENLVLLGLKEYEARIYVALVGLGEANVRRIHEASGVPRPRVYDVLNSLAARGFIEVREGSPLMYHALRPDIVVAFLKKDLDTAARESVTALETMSVNAEKNYSPIWYVHSDWTIQRNLEMLAERVTRQLIIICFDNETLSRFQGPIASVAQRFPVRVLVPEGGSEGIPAIGGIQYYEAGEQKDFFGQDIFKDIFSAPVSREGSLFRLECIVIADDRESMFMYTQNGNRMAVVITLPFITCVQSRLFSRMIGQANEIAGDRKLRGSGPGTTMKKIKSKRPVITV